MPYNTRRKSLSLPSLGIHIPVTHAARAAAAASRQSPNTAKSPRLLMESQASVSGDDSRPNKKMKRVHGDGEDTDVAHSSKPLAKKRNDATPPPSPLARFSVEMDDAKLAVDAKIRLEGINDEIVEAVLVRLQNTGNRPHLVKELTAVLMRQLKIVQLSANPCAIISSRLSTFLKRTYWSDSAPCPLAKELETVHPRRTYFYLTTCPHPPLPDAVANANADAVALTHITRARTSIDTPSLSSATSSSEEADLELRRELSPSPEVDLSAPEFDDVDDEMPWSGMPIGLQSTRGYFPNAAHRFYHRHHGSHDRKQTGEPPLEKDEKEFTQTADGLQKRKLSGDLMLGAAVPMTSIEMDYGIRLDDGALFGGAEKSLSGAMLATSILTPPSIAFVTSPAMKPSSLSPNFLGKRDGETETWARVDQMLEWDRSPEMVDLEELDYLLSGY